MNKSKNIPEFLYMSLQENSHSWQIYCEGKRIITARCVIMDPIAILGYQNRDESFLEYLKTQTLQIDLISAALLVSFFSDINETSKESALLDWQATPIQKRYHTGIDLIYDALGIEDPDWIDSIAFNALTSSYTVELNYAAWLFEVVSVDEAGTCKRRYEND